MPVEAPEIHLNARDKFCTTTFYTNVEESETEMRRKGNIYKVISKKISFLSVASCIGNSMILYTINFEKYSQVN